MKRLKLEITDFEDDAQWAWRLVDRDGVFLADHEVALDRAAGEYVGYLNLHAFVRWNTAPDSAGGDERVLIERIMRWMRTEAWGPVGDAILNAAEEEPLVVHVVVPESARILLFRPFELSLVLDEAPGALDVSLVFDLADGTPTPARSEIGNQLRMLALFSMPTDQAALNIRNERRELRRLIQRVTQTAGRAVELRILQYGVTRRLLEEVLDEGDGWDLIHFSGHGLPSGLIMERENGKADLVHSNEFAKLLWPTRGQLKLVTLSSCESGATTAAHTMQLLGIAPPETNEVEGSPEDLDGSLPAVAQHLADEIGCAALAMRYPVEDEFAVGLAVDLYEGMLAAEQTLPRALQRALGKAASRNEDQSNIGLSLATPALFGSAALDLSLAPPPGHVEAFDPSSTKLAYFEPEPETFVGRVGALAAGSAALAPKSEYRGVLFHGMAGAGKTACALELAYRHEDRRFEAMAWYRAPSEGRDIGGALAQFAISLEMQLDGLELAHAVDDVDKLTRFLPRLRSLLASRSLLIAIDNVESLLTDGGKWRDLRWEHLVGALVDHDGLSRLVMTSRTPPDALSKDPRMRVEPIHSLSARESVLLARHLPNLNRLMSPKSEIGQPAGRTVVRRTLEIVQGNPKLMELADSQAADVSALQAGIATADEAWADDVDLGAFFATGKPAEEIGANDFLRVIVSWANRIIAALPENQHSIFKLICCMEAEDRFETMVDHTWNRLQDQLIEGASGPTELRSAVVAIAKQGLIDIEDEGSIPVFRIHPAVEQTERQTVGEAFQRAVDTEMVQTWIGAHRHGNERQDTSLVVRSGLGAAPYLLRLGLPKVAASALSAAVAHDPSTRTLAAALPYLMQALAQAEGTEDELRARGALLQARAAQRSGDVIPEFEELLDAARQAEDFLGATVVLADLFNELLRGGRLKEAGKVVEAAPEFTRRADLGPWSQMADEGMRLQLMDETVDGETLLKEASQLRERMEALPEDSDATELAQPWNVREVILGIARSAAMELEDWDEVLALNAAVRKSEEDRGASPLERATTDFNDYGALLELGHVEKSERVLRRLRQMLEEAGDGRTLGEVFSAWGDLESRRNHIDEAILFEARALRLKYRLNEPAPINISHNNLANYLEKAGQNPDEVVAHRLATALVSYQTASRDMQRDLTVLAMTLAKLGLQTLPSSYAVLCSRVDKIDGVEFDRFFKRLPEKHPNGDEALTVVVGEARRLAGTLELDS